MTATADVLDLHGDDAAVCTAPLRSFGGRSSFSGPIATVRCDEDNVLVKQRVAEPGNGRVLVVDAGGSLRCALVGDNVAGAAHSNGWVGLVINGCVRDVEALADLAIGIKAIGTCPRPSNKDGEGAVDVPVVFGSATFRPGAMLWSDEDGILVLDRS